MGRRKQRFAGSRPRTAYFAESLCLACRVALPSLLSRSISSAESLSTP